MICHVPGRLVRTAFQVVLLLLAVLPGCSGMHGDAGSDELPGDCVAYADSYEACLRASAPSQTDVVHARAELTRTSLKNNMQRMGSSALSAKCREGSVELEKSCGSPRGAH